MLIDCNISRLRRIGNATPGIGTVSVCTDKGCSLYFSSALFIHFPLAKGSTSSKVSVKNRLSIGSLELLAFTTAAKAVARNRSCKVIDENESNSWCRRNWRWLAIQFCRSAFVVRSRCSQVSCYCHIDSIFHR